MVAIQRIAAAREVQITAIRSLQIIELIIEAAKRIRPATIIAFSLGYATPHCAANILKDAHERQENWSEWIYECYGADPLPAVWRR